MKIFFEEKESLMVKQFYDKEELVRCANGELFSPESGKLPLDEMLLIDRITEITVDGGKYGKGYIVAEYDINPDLWFFKVHFKDDPVMPGSLGFDALLQLTGFFLVWSGIKGKGRALGCDKLQFRGQVLPTHKKVKYVIDIKRVIQMKLVMIIADGALFVDDEEIYTVENIRVGVF